MPLVEGHQRVHRDQTQHDQGRADDEHDLKKSCSQSAGNLAGHQHECTESGAATLVKVITTPTSSRDCGH